MSSDHDTVAITREAKATYILATQSITSLAPKLDSQKLDALILNLSNQIYFTVADSKSAKLVSEVFGEHTITEESRSTGNNGSTVNRREVEKPIYKPSELRSLNKYQCIIKHPDGMKSCICRLSARKEKYHIFIIEIDLESLDGCFI